MFVEPRQIRINPSLWTKESGSPLLTLLRWKDFGVPLSSSPKAENPKLHDEGAPPFRMIYHAPGSGQTWCVSEAHRVCEARADWQLLYDELHPALDRCDHEDRMTESVKRRVVSLLIQSVQGRYGIVAEHVMHRKAVNCSAGQLPHGQDQRLVEIYDAWLLTQNVSHAGVLYVTLNGIRFHSKVIVDSASVLPWTKIKHADLKDNRIRIRTHIGQTFELLGSWQDPQQTLSLMHVLASLAAPEQSAGEAPIVADHRDLRITSSEEPRVAESDCGAPVHKRRRVQ